MRSTRLPHKEPLIFIGQLLEQNETSVTFQTHFPFTPTLAMLCEASTQGTSFFSLSPDCNMGVVSSFRNIKKITSTTNTHFSMSVTLKHSFANSYLYEFSAFDNNVAIVRGEIAVFYTSI